VKTVAFTDTQLRTHYRSALLIEIQAGEGSSTFFRYTNWTTNLTIDVGAGPVLFTREAFVLINMVSSVDESQSSASSFEDQEHLIKGIALTGNFTAWPITVWEVRWDMNGGYQGVEEVISGLCNGVDFAEDGETARAEIGILASRLPEQGPAPRQVYARTCRFRYKGPQCQATSSLPTCGRTLGDCIARNNQPRYGGFPFAPKPRARFVWGSYQEVINARDVSWGYGG
jgi:hypothetical protein